MNKLIVSCVKSLGLDNFPVSTMLVYRLLAQEVGNAAIVDERERQKTLVMGGKSADDFDKGNSKEDWICIIIAYLGRAADVVFRNDHSKQREMLIKAGALCKAAYDASNKGWC